MQHTKASYCDTQATSDGSRDHLLHPTTRNGNWKSTVYFLIFFFYFNVGKTAVAVIVSFVDYRFSVGEVIQSSSSTGNDSRRNIAGRQIGNIFLLQCWSTTQLFCLFSFSVATWLRTKPSCTRGTRTTKINFPREWDSSVGRASDFPFHEEEQHERSKLITPGKLYSSQISSSRPAKNPSKFQKHTLCQIVVTLSLFIDSGESW